MVSASRLRRSWIVLNASCPHFPDLSRSNEIMQQHSTGVHMIQEDNGTKSVVYPTFHFSASSAVSLRCFLPFRDPDVLLRKGRILESAQ